MNEKTTTTRGISIPQELLDELDDVRWRQRRSRSSAITEAIKLWLRHQKPESRHNQKRKPQQEEQ
jgi:metal-responsive CopG/Arc/MetJ family transcriptional regulator